MSKELIIAGKSPSVEAMIHTDKLAIVSGGVTQDFSANVQNLRETMRKLNYVDGNKFFAESKFSYVPSSYAEGKNFSQSNNRNLLKFSEEFDNNSYWFKANGLSVVANQAISPDGTLTADKLIRSGSAGDPLIYQLVNVNGIANKTFTLSVWLWSNVNRDVQLFIYGNTGVEELKIKDINGITSTPTRYTLTGTFTATAVSTTLLIRLDMANSTPDGGDMYIWGAHLEQSPIPTPYQRTTDGILDFNFTRATSARVVNKQGIIEDSCYNLLQRSEEFENASWSRANSTVASNSIMSPIRTLTADKLIEDTTTSIKRIFQLVTGNPGLYSYSIYCKKAERDIALILLSDNLSGGIQATVNLTNGTLSPLTIIGGWTDTFSSITYIEDGWFLIRVSGNKPVSTVVDCEFRLNGGTNYLGDGVSGIYIWGAQLTQGSTPRPYLRTTNRLNVPRLDYSRSLLEPSLLIEPQRSNLVLWSEDMSNVVWNKQNIIVTLNSTLNPFGVNKSYYLTDNNINASHYCTQALTLTTGSIYTSSFYVKKADHSWCQFALANPGFSTTTWANFNFDTGLFGNKGTTGTWNAKLLSNGYWLITVVATAVASGISSTALIAGCNNIDTSVVGLVYIGASSKICDIAAIQLEQGANATSYIPTTTTAVTRNTETSFVDLSNSNCVNPNNFTLHIEGYIYSVGGNNSIILSDTTTYQATNNIGWTEGSRGLIYNSTVPTGIGTSLPDNNYYKFVVVRDGTSVKFFRNGVQLGATQIVPVFNYRYLVQSAGTSTYTIDKINLFNRTLLDSECISLTL